MLKGQGTWIYFWQFLSILHGKRAFRHDQQPVQQSRIVKRANASFWD